MAFISQTANPTMKSKEFTYPKILLIATISYAGMGPYVASIVNSFEPEDNIRFLLVENEDRYYTRNIKPSIIDKCTIFHETATSSIHKLYDMIFSTKYQLHDEIIRECKRYDVSVIHYLTPLINEKLATNLINNYNLLNTVHDLHPHEANKALFKQWRNEVMNKRIQNNAKRSNYYYTNSKQQLYELKGLFSEKASFYTPFPSLISAEIKEGDMKVPEIEGVKDYVLFFGRIEAYKGLGILLDAFEMAALPVNSKLVIAGKGDIDKSRTKSDNVIFINRFIDDREVKYLYKNARCVVYPYISATQSGVLSVASYFGTPIIASDVDFFREILGDDYEYIFKTGDAESLSLKISSIYNTNISHLIEYSKNLYSEKYDQRELRKQLFDIYSTINCHKILHY